MTSSVSFLTGVENIWVCEVCPIIEDVYECITKIIEKGDDKEVVFKKNGAVDIYTKIYNMTTHPQVDSCHLDFLYNKEITSVVEFVKRFSIHNLKEMNRQVLGFKILIKWFQCFFHHLNRFRYRAYYNIGDAQDEMTCSIRNYYIEPQIEIISHLICSKWADIRNNNYQPDFTLSESMDLILDFHPDHYNELLFYYFNSIRDYSQQKSDEWFSQKDYLVFMKNVNECFQKERGMFLQYFTQHTELTHIYTILKKSFIYPYYELLLYDNNYGWKVILQSNNFSSIQTAYYYFSQVEDITQWSMLYNEFIEGCISSISTDDVVRSLSQLLKTQSNLLEDVFIDEKIRIHFITILEKNVQKKMNNHQLSIQLTRAIHNTINKKSSKRTLRDLSVLVGFCPDKDIFYEHYQNHLKTRLLSGRFIFSHEKMMLDILQIKMGVSFTLNLYLMLAEIQNNYVAFENCSIYKLSSIIWNFENKNRLLYKVPDDIRGCVHTLYTELRRGTKPSIRLELMWLCGSVVLTRSNVDYYMSPIQAITLLALEEPLNRQQLVEKLGICDDNLHNLDGVLDSLKKVMLIVYDDGKYYWGGPSTCAITKVVVPPVKNKKDQPSQQKDNNSISFIVIEAFIIKTLKKEKTMRYFNLMDVVSKTYKIQLVDIKKLIEKLIDREFISRDGADMLSYVP